METVGCRGLSIFNFREFFVLPLNLALTILFAVFTILQVKYCWVDCYEVGFLLNNFLFYFGILCLFMLLILFPVFVSFPFLVIVCSALISLTCGVPHPCFQLVIIYPAICMRVQLFSSYLPHLPRPHIVATLLGG